MVKRHLKKAVDVAAKRSVRVHNAVRRIGNDRLQKRFAQLIEENEADDRTIVFISFMGRGYSDSPLALYRQVLKDPFFDDWKFVWVFKKINATEFDGKKDLARDLLLDSGVKIDNNSKLAQYTRATTVIYNTPEYYETLAKSKYWVSNSRIQDGVQPGDSHVYVQTWHGTPLKRLGADIEVGANAVHSTENLAAIYKQEAEKWKYLLSPSDFYTEKLKSAFLIDKKSDVEIIQEGYPRNDYLANASDKEIETIKKKLSIPKDKKVLLYAPTWRDDQHNLKQGYTYDVGADFDKLQKELGQEWVILFRAHYFIANRFDFSKYEGFVYDVSNHHDINELYVAADTLMTDYSSVFFDYSILQRPIVFFMYDKKRYASELRGFYLELDELPGEIVETNDRVVSIMKDIDDYTRKYRKDLKSFTNRFCKLDDGNSSARVIEKIFKKNSIL